MLIYYKGGLLWCCEHQIHQLHCYVCTKDSTNWYIWCTTMLCTPVALSSVHLDFGALMGHHTCLHVYTFTFCTLQSAQHTVLTDEDEISLCEHFRLLCTIHRKTSRWQCSQHQWCTAIHTHPWISPRIPYINSFNTVITSFSTDFSSLKTDIGKFSEVISSFNTVISSFRKVISSFNIGFNSDVIPNDSLILDKSSSVSTAFTLRTPHGTVDKAKGQCT